MVFQYYHTINHQLQKRLQSNFVHCALLINLQICFLIKFSPNIKINKDNLKKQIKNQNNTNSISYLLSEIFFEASNVSEVKKKSKEINAYIEKENKRAKKHNYKSPICESKDATDINFNEGAKFILSNLEPCFESKFEPIFKCIIYCFCLAIQLSLYSSLQFF